MPLDPLTSSPPVTLRPHGWARMLPAAFMAFWLCGWAMGEAFAIAGLAGALHALTGLPIPEALSRVRTGPREAVPVLAFLLVWFSFWTLGGIAAMGALASLLWGSDEIAWDREHVEVRHRAFPFFRTTRLAFADVMRLELRGGGPLIALGRTGRKVLTGYGTPPEREALLQQLRAARAAAGPCHAGREQPGVPGSEADLPRGWRATPDETGELALLESPGPTRVAGGVFAVLALLLGGLGATLAVEAMSTDGPTGRAIGAVVMLLLAGLAALGAAALASTRRTIHARPGSIEERVSRLARTRARTWTPAALAVEREVDSDGDERWSLVVRAPGAGPGTLISAADDPVPGVLMGRWLAARARVPFADGVPDSTRPAA
jgi:hypothetical protein